jgi:hypothetical protein
MLDEFRRLVLKDDPEDSFLSVTSWLLPSEFMEP